MWFNSTILKKDEMNYRNPTAADRRATARGFSSFLEGFFQSIASGTLLSNRITAAQEFGE
jgi:hypothetical protein